METKLNIEKTSLEISFQDFYIHLINYHFLLFVYFIIIFKQICENRDCTNSMSSMGAFGVCITR